MKVYLLLGPPGVGKTRRSKVHAKETNSEYVYALLHQWSDADELFVGVNVQAVVSGDVQNIPQEGVLMTTATKSLKGPVTLCLDEIDKTSEATEDLLLDFLQYGRVPVRPGVQIQAAMENITVFITSNDKRPLSDALLRRCKRVFMKPLPFEQQVEILQAESNLPSGVVRIAWKAALWCAVQDGNPHLSLHEGHGLMEDLASVGSKGEVIEHLTGWAIRSAENENKVAECPFINPLWGELKGYLASI